jgi:hypothetical protein
MPQTLSQHTIPHTTAFNHSQQTPSSFSAKREKEKTKKKTHT